MDHVRPWQNASLICTDKTGNLTQNEMTAAAGAIDIAAIHARFLQKLDENPAAGPGASNEDAIRTRANARICR